MGHWTAYSVHTLISRNDFGLNSWSITDPTLLAALRSDPGGFYADVRTHESPMAPCVPSCTCSTIRSPPAEWPPCRSRWSSAARFYGCTVLSHGSSPVGHARVRESSC